MDNENPNAQGRPAGPGAAHRSAPLPRVDAEAVAAGLRRDDLLVDGDALDLKAYARVITKHKWVVLGAMAIVIVGVMILTLLSTPIYRATTLLQIEREALKVVEFGGDQRPVEDGSAVDFYQTQYELLKSRALAERVVAALAPSATDAGSIQDGLSVEPVRNSPPRQGAFRQQ
jgi:polysaccharide biosynthesis transport protein